MEQKYALVTGASSGCGVQYARVMARRGYHLIIVSNEDAICTRAEEIHAEFPTIQIIPLVRDLGTQSAAKELYDYCHNHKLEVEVLINNAGVYHDKDILDDSERFNELILNLHMFTPAMLCYYFGKDMAERGEGYILNMCSVTKRMAIQRLGTYGGTKAFLSHFTRSLHIELKHKGVRVIDVSPGAIDTGLYNINGFFTRMGKALGFIVSPEYLANRAVRAMFRGQHKATIPFVWGYFLEILVLLLPTCLLKLIRRVGLF